MKSVTLASVLMLIMSGAASRQARDTPAQPKNGAGAIAGTVVLDESGSPPARKVRVTLNSVDRGVSGMTATTDDTGAFAFGNVPAGRYTLQATKAGFLTANYGARRPEREGTSLALADGQRLTDVKLALARGAVITGTVFDRSGRPAPDVAVTVLRYGWSPFGERTLGQYSRGGSGVTDDRGIYRAWGLPPGEYVVMATLRLSGVPAGARPEDFQPLTTDEVRRVQALVASGRGGPGAGRADALDTAPVPASRAVMYAPVFFRGTTDLAASTTITLGIGEERNGVDFQIQVVPTATIEGTLSLPASADPRTISVTLQQGGTQGQLLGAAGGRGSMAARPSPEGKFSFAGVAPGQYTVAARAIAGAVQALPANSPARTLWAQADLSIDGRDTNVALELQPGMTIKGRLVFEGTSPPPTNLPAFRIWLIPPGSGGNLGAGPPGGQVDAEGKFTFTGVTPGFYRFLQSMPSATGPNVWRLKGSTANGRDAFDAPLRVTAGENLDWVLTFTDRPSELEGVLQDASGRQAPDYFIVVFPVDRAYWTPGSRRVASPRPGSDGTYIVALPPGEYYVAALTDLDNGDLNRAQFLDQLVGSAVRVTLRDGQKTRQDLRIR
jgi:uncharacterized protein (DUF2141 family)